MSSEIEKMADEVNRLHADYSDQCAEADLRRQWQRVFDGDAPDALREHLESWARTAEAGELLDWVCAKWIGWADSLPDNLVCGVCGAPITGHDSGNSCASCTPPWPQYSEFPGAAMVLLESMATLQTTLWLGRTRWKLQVALGNGASEVIGCAENPRLAIARAAAVLCARGIDAQGGQ